ncbi:hypothetical protein ACIA49_19025 [Kribbella sp. NPDC051587]|uniref:hypothetical protein n=1 Tax=Kribbella sp. NPDC051587 TaxID=3364119 RepID=UPI003795B0F2
MRHVRVEFDRDGTSSDPGGYLERLPSIADALPVGARAFATDPEHYNFGGRRCIKDLKPQHLRSVGDGLELQLKHNCWKHEEDLTIRYTGVQSVTLNPPGDVARLRDVMLDEILPIDHGCTHEFTCLSGSILIACEDLTATWIDSNCPDLDRS